MATRQKPSNPSSDAFPNHLAAVPSRDNVRRQLTLVFCDLVGRTTTLAATADAGEVSVVLDDYRRTCFEIIRSHGGLIVSYVGDGLIACFGFEQAGEHDAERAVRAALALVEVLPKLPTPEGVPWQVRIGIATGVEESRSGLLGGIAARLQLIAEPNAVVIEEGTRRLLGDRFELRALRSQRFRDASGLLAAWTVQGSRESVIAQGPPLGAASSDIIRRTAEKVATDDTVAGAVEVDLDDLLESEEERRAYFDAFGADAAATFIRSARRMAGLSQTELAKRMGVSQSRIAELERGGVKQGVTTGLLARVAEACGKKLLLTLE